MDITPIILAIIAALGGAGGGGLIAQIITTRANQRTAEAQAAIASDRNAVEGFASLCDRLSERMEDLERAIISREARIKELEEGQAELKRAIERRDQEIASLRREVDALRRERDELKRQIQQMVR